MSINFRQFREGVKSVQKPLDQTPDQVPAGERAGFQQRAAQVANDAERYQNPTDALHAVVGQDNMAKLKAGITKRAAPLRARMAASSVPDQPGDEDVDFDAIDQQRANTKAAQYVTQRIAPDKVRTQAKELARSARAGIQGNIPIDDKFQRASMIGLGDQDFTSIRDFASAMQDLRVYDRNAPNFPSFTIDGEKIDLFDPSFGLSTTAAGSPGSGGYSEDELIELIRATAATDEEGMPRLVDKDGNFEGLSDEAQRFFPLQANFSSVTQSDMMGTRGTAVNPGGNEPYLFQLQHISPQMNQAAYERGEISEEEFDQRRERMELIRRVQDVDNPDMEAALKLHEMSKRREVTQKDIDFVKDLVFGGRSSKGRSQKGGIYDLRKKGAPDRYADTSREGEMYAKWKKGHYNGTYAGFNDDWVQSLPPEQAHLADLAKEFTGNLLAPIEGEDYSQYTDKKEHQYQLPSQSIPMPETPGVRPGDMLDRYAVNKEMQRLIDKEEYEGLTSEEFKRKEGLGDLLDMATSNRVDAQIRTWLEQEGREMGNPQNIVSIIKGDLEHAMSLSRGGRDHPVHWHTLESNINQGRVNVPAEEWAENEYVNKFNLTDPQAATDYQANVLERKNKKLLENRIKKLPDSPAKTQALEELRKTPYAQLTKKEFVSPPVAPPPLEEPPNLDDDELDEDMMESKYEQMPVIAESFMNFRYSYVRQLVEEQDVWNYQEAHEAGYSVAKWYRAALAKKGYEFDANGDVLGIQEARYHIKQAQDKKQEIEGKGKAEKDEKEKEGLRKQYRAWDRLEKSETEYYNKYGDTIKSRGAADKRKEEEPDDKPRSYYKKPPITDKVTLDLIKKLRAKGKGKK